MLWVPHKGVLRRQTNVGSVGATNYGTSVTGGAAAAKGSVVQLLASTDFDAYWVRVMASAYGSSGVISGGCLDILVGAATESILIPDLLMGNAGSMSAARQGPKVWDFPLYIPAGTRVSARVSGERNATACIVGISLYGGNGAPAWRVGSKVSTYGVVSTVAGTPVTAGTAVEGAWTEMTSGTSEGHFAFVPSLQAQNNSLLTTNSYSVDLGVGAATEEEIGGPYLFACDLGEMMGGPFFSHPTFCDVASSTRLVMRASSATTPDAGIQGAIHAVS